MESITTAGRRGNHPVRTPESYGSRKAVTGEEIADIEALDRAIYGRGQEACALHLEDLRREHGFAAARRH